MAAPRYAPESTTTARSYRSPDHVPERWEADRPGDTVGFHVHGHRAGSPGPDQGFVLKIANALRTELHLREEEHPDDVIRGCLGVALKRASLFSRAPVVHDLRVAFTVWGFLDPEPDIELVALRRGLFEGLRHVGHHYVESRIVVDYVNADTLMLTPEHVAAGYAADWRTALER